MPEIILDKRMGCIADCVRSGAVLADIGTDHGKLPIYLAQKGKIRRAVAADINEMPLNKAKNNITKYGLCNMIDTYLTDGLAGIEKYKPTDVVIAGMGGELIMQILERQTVEKSGIRYILQPMTKEDTLRRYLCENGYSIIDEYIVKEGKIYQIICAEYTGEKTELTPALYMLGKINVGKKSNLLIELCEKTAERERIKTEGKRSAGLNVADDEKCLADLLAIKEGLNG